MNGPQGTLTISVSFNFVDPSRGGYRNRMAVLHRAHGLTQQQAQDIASKWREQNEEIPSANLQMTFTITEYL